MPDGARLEDFGDDVLLPGLVDTHVHVNDPGRTEWEGFWTATRAAAAGGITTLLDMPLNSLPPTTTVDHLRTKQDVAADQGAHRRRLLGRRPPRQRQGPAPAARGRRVRLQVLPLALRRGRVPRSWTRTQLARSMAEIAGFGGLLIVHAEDPHQLAAAPQQPRPEVRRLPASRPRDAENAAIEGLIAQAKRLDARVHVLHLSSSDALPLIAAAKREGVRITVETCPHYLTLTAEEVPDGATEFKCCPPIREAANQDLLWQALADGTIDCIVSDHSPVHRRPQDRRLRDRLGRHLRPPARPARGLDRGPQARPHPGGRGPLDVDAHLPTWSGSTPQGRHRGRAATPTSRSSPPTRPSPSTRRHSSTATRSRRTRARPCTAS